MKVCGLDFSQETVNQIRQKLHLEPQISRRGLARFVCALWDWRAASGRLKETVCRKALVVLNNRGIITLGRIDHCCEKRSKSQVSRTTCDVKVAEVECTLRELGAIEIEMVPGGGSRQLRIWNQLMDDYHYLGKGAFCGAQIRYLIRSPIHGYLGAIGFSSASWALKERDAYIGWSEAARRSNLERVVCNSRFLIIPGVRVPNLASHVLSRCVERVGRDWLMRYGVDLVLVETFVDLKRFSATTYRAANWVCIGQTSGRRAGTAEGAKGILIYPLRSDFREVLCHEPVVRLGQRARAIDPADWVEDEFSTVELHDPRLSRRLMEVTRDFISQPQALIPQACGSYARARGAYRLFANGRVSMEELLRAHKESSIERINGRDVVLAVQDTTTLNYTPHHACEGLGPIGSPRENVTGLIVHDTMAFTSEGTPLGLLDVQCWARDPDDIGKKHRRKELPIEQKESMKWLKSYRMVSEVQHLCPETMLVSVGDRESDIYDLFVEATRDPKGPKLLVRCERSRNRKTESDVLWEQMAKTPVAGHLVVDIPKRNTQQARQARLAVRHAQVTLKAPKNSGHPSLLVWMVYAQEVDYAESVKNPLEWMLLTTVVVNTLEDACERLSWYARRWGIEVYHRTLKSGCRIEDRRLENAKSIEACLAIDMVVAWRIYHLTQLSREFPDHPCTEFFQEAEWKALYIIVKNDLNLLSKPPTLREATHMIASLGGFLGRKCDGEPGTTHLWRGLQRHADFTRAYLTFLPYLNLPP